MRLRQLVAKATVASAIGFSVVGLAIGMAHHPPSAPQVPTLPNVPAAAPPALAPAMGNANEATANAYEAAMANEATVATGNQLVPTITATPFDGERTRSSAVAGLNRDGWAEVTSIPLLGPSGGLLG